MKRRARATKRARKRRSAPRVSARAAAAPDLRPRPGLEASVEKVVPREWTLAHFDPRLPAVFSTPAMIGLMEHASAEAVLADLPPGAITVGTRIEVDHLKALPEGSMVRASARLVKHRGRFLIFEVEARSGELVIGRGFVYRAIVEQEKFHAKARTHSS